MAQRVIKIILPLDSKKTAIELLEAQENTIFWQEESSNGNFVVSSLTEAGHSEAIMDIFERNFSSTKGFKLIVFPVEASIPRTDVAENNLSSDLEEKNAKKEKDVASRISREELYSGVVDSAKLSKTFVYMSILSTVVVAIGLQNNNVAVIIGAMVIAPFLGPNVALALSTCLADKELGWDALKTLCGGVVIVLLLSMCMGYFFETNVGTPEIYSRMRADFSDIILALASGCAGVLAFTTGASSAVIGVMVAVALLPPLSVCGLLLGAGQYHGATGALLLFLTNIICINLAGVATFLVQGVSPRIWWEATKAKKATIKALILWSVLLMLLSVIIYSWKS
ncbi:MAG: TIGR00341 family protein [Desulfobacterales bacterium]|jgi:uncharacterized hydrophobic protein (TIGR00341 family)|nr:TIGR00341 family protein [Desulfobacteraceae bacterium]MBT4363020.1 TIGR00341 family protein [Desulfobacteraceae bacterium]MBT7085519.1 TIGR00341 family protein [Desulfobacterales bacterium]